jgi:hypothetical protein
VGALIIKYGPNSWMHLLNMEMINGRIDAIDAGGAS